MVAVHPRDIDGAARAGLRTAWIDRAGGPYPGYLTPPDHRVSSLGELAARLSGPPAEPSIDGFRLSPARPPTDPQRWS
jgi:2-haloacid dehalogenase